MSKVYSAAPVVPMVARAVDVRSTAPGAQARVTPARARCSAIILPWWSAAKLVASRTGRSSRARATATLAALPPAYSCGLPLCVCTMSTSDSPTTSTPRCMRRLYHVDERIGRVSDSAAPGSQLFKVLGLAAMVDLLTGIVLSVIGVTQDIQALAIVGVVLLLSGGGLLAYVSWQRNKPTVL
jgi:hypothetical protein